MRLYELFDKGELDYDYGSAKFTAETTLSDGSVLEVSCRRVRGTWDVQFLVDGGTETTGAGIEIEVFGNVMVALREFMTHYTPDSLSFTAKGNSRVSLYRKFLNRYGSGLKVYEFPRIDSVAFMAVRGELMITSLKHDTGTIYSTMLFDSVPRISVVGTVVEIPKEVEAMWANAGSKELVDALFSKIAKEEGVPISSLEFKVV